MKQLSKLIFFLRLLWSYYQSRRLRFTTRDALVSYQAKRLKRFTAWLTSHSPYFAQLAGRHWTTWPLMNKAILVEQFDQINTAGLRINDVFTAAIDAEVSRDFSMTVKGITVGLSSGTSSMRGVFAVSSREQATWAGAMLAKMLPQGLFAGERVALFLRANSNLYASVDNPWLAFHYFDLFQPFNTLLNDLRHYQPTIIIAPAQVLCELARHVAKQSVMLNPKRVISVAEVLDAADRALIAQVFGTVHEVYQATEGFLAATCAHGQLHINEEYLHVEPEWLDSVPGSTEPRRFVPIVTDFTRRTQPIVRYRLNDVLIEGPARCACGSATRTIAAVEGRCDDMLLLPAAVAGDKVTVFADMLSRAIAQTLPRSADYRLTQIGEYHLRIQCDIADADFDTLKQHMIKTFTAVGVAADSLTWEFQKEMPNADPTTKRRRIQRVSL